MPRADTILFILAGFLALWSVSLLARGVWSDRPRGRRRCPACRLAIPDRAVKECDACGYRSARERDFHALHLKWRMLASGAAVLATTPAIFYAGLVVRRWADFSGVPGHTFGPWTAAAIGVILFGLALIGRAAWGDRSRGRRRCPKCWYDMNATPTLVCPECGHDATDVSALYRTRRLRRPALIGIAVVILGALGFLITPFKTGGWRTWIPSSVLVGWFEDLPGPFILPGANVPFDERNLAGRVMMGKLSPAQSRTLHAKCLEILRHSDDPALLLRAGWFADYADPAVAEQVLRRALDALSTDPPSIPAYPYQGVPGITGTVRASASLQLRLAERYPQLIKLTTSPDRRIAGAAAMLVAMRDPAIAVADLTAAAKANRSRRGNVNLALVMIGRTSDEGRRALVGQLDDDDPFARMLALLSLFGLTDIDLQWFGPEAAPAALDTRSLVFLTQFNAVFETEYARMEDQLTNDSATPGRTFASINAVRAELCARLLPHAEAFLASANSSERAEAARSVGELALYAPCDLDALERRLGALADDPDPAVRAAAGEAAMKIHAHKIAAPPK